ncbi:MAG: transposase, partial [Myxococcaceae bacterium]
MLRRVLRQLAKDFEGMEVGWPEDGLEGLQAQAAQHRLPLPEEPRKARGRVAVLEGFSLHADTAVHANDREGLARLCGYGSRGPLSLERLSRREDGQYEYRTKRGPVLVLSASALVKRLLAVVPPSGTHLTCFHGVFAPNAALRPLVVLKPPALLATPVLRTSRERVSLLRPPRLDW